MSGPFTKTQEVLSTSEFPEAMELLVLALESSQETVARVGALGLLKRSGLQGQREILLRFPRLPFPVQADVQLRSPSFDPLFRQQLMQGTVEQRQEALYGIRLLHASEQIPNLLQLMCRTDLPDLDAVVQCLQDLVMLLDEDVRNTSNPESVRSSLLTRREKALVHLEQGLIRYDALVTKEPLIESILILGTAQHSAVKKVLWQGSPDCRERAGKMLLSSRHPKVMRQILETMKQQYPHPKAFEAVRTRTDIEFLCELLRAVSAKLGPMFEQNLRQIDAFAWLEADDPPFGLIPPQLQPALLTLVFSTRVSEERKLQTQDWMLRHGGPAGRMAAAERAALLDEQVLQDVLVNSLDAEDEHVQAWAVSQLRQHAVPETFVLLLERLDSPSDEVRAAVKNELSDFSVERVLGMIDGMDVSTAERSGELLRKLDEHAAAKLERELKSAIRPKRIRAAKAVVKLGFQELLQKPLLALATDSDFMIRRTAAEVLEMVLAPEVLPALDRLARDQHPRVREAALKALSTWQHQSAADLDPVLMQ